MESDIKYWVNIINEAYEGSLTIDKDLEKGRKLFYNRE